MRSRTQIELFIKEPSYGVREDFWPALWNNYRMVDKKTNKISHIKIQITIRQVKCPYCKEFLFSDDDWEYILEHEITEAICCKVYSMEPKIPLWWNGEGFNNVFETIHMRKKKHRCGLREGTLEFG